MIFTSLLQDMTDTLQFCLHIFYQRTRKLAYKLYLLLLFVVLFIVLIGFFIIVLHFNKKTVTKYVPALAMKHDISGIAPVILKHNTTWQ